MTLYHLHLLYCLLDDLLLLKVTFYQVFVVVALVILAMRDSGLVATWEI